MSTLEFIFEKPQKAPKATSRRSRLITACDSCRTRKLKCRPSKRGRDACESCSQSGLVCEFKERDHIRAQRGIASFSVKPEKASKTKATKNTQLVTKLDLPLVASSQTSSRGFSIPRIDFIDRGPSSLFGSSSQGWNIITSHCTQLFDPVRHNYPHPQLLPRLTLIFFEYTRGIFNFFDEEDLLDKAHKSTLSVLLANCISAYAIRFYDEFPHSPGARHVSSAPFVDTAKSLVSEEIALSKLEVAQCLILLAWIENGTGAMESKLLVLLSLAIRSWVPFADPEEKIAARTTLELKLDSEENIMLDPSPKIRDQKRRTFWAIAWLDLLSCSVVSKAPLINLDNCTTAMPCPEIVIIGSLSRHQLYSALKSVLGIMAKLYRVSNSGSPNLPSAARDNGLLRLQAVMLEFREDLPHTMAFTMENLRYADEMREGYYFHVTHALVHSMVVVLNCPALFWTSQFGSGPPPVPRMDVAWSSILNLVDIFVFGGKNNHRLPVAINSFSVPLGIARGALLLAQKHTVHTMSSVGMSEDTFHRTSQLYLNETLRLLMDLSIYWASVQQVKIASEPVTLYGVNSRQDSGLFVNEGQKESRGRLSEINTPDEDAVSGAQLHGWHNPTTSAQIMHDLMQPTMYKHISVIKLPEDELPLSSSGSLVRFQPPRTEEYSRINLISSLN